MPENPSPTTLDLSHHFLVSMPALADDPQFGQALIYLCEHNADGALGLIVNRPADMAVSELLAQAGIAQPDGPVVAGQVLHGGPVKPDRGFVLHRGGADFKSSLAVADGVRLTSSLDVLEAMAAGELGDAALVTLGYCGWAAGQLEDELLRNSWLTLPARADILFDLPAAARRDAALSTLGLDYGRLSAEAGHA